MRKVIIIGSGPAGYTAAIYASRAGLNPLLFTGMKIGGQLMDTNDIENFPGYSKGITGTLMMEDLRNQALRFGTEIIYSTIIDVNFSVKSFKITDELNNEYLAKSLIISTGAEAKLLGIESEHKFWGSGVSACATCDGFFFKNKNVVVVGGGDTACEEALYLSNICTHVTVLVRGDKMRASTIMQLRIKEKSNINVLYNTSVVEIKGNKIVDSIIINENNNIYALETNAVFVAIGHKPNTELFVNKLSLDDNGYIITNAKSSLTSVSGVFACGDVQDSIYRQAITAAGSGCMAALDCERYLTNS